MATIESPLEGIKVIELGTWVAVPTAAAILGDWGADVIKVENLNGDTVRGFTHSGNIEIKDIHFWWHLNNRNKRGITLDINKEPGREVLRKLIGKSDVFLTNSHPSILKRWNLEYGSLTKLNPRLVFANFTGLGEKGPDTNRPGFDRTAFWARGGFMHLLCEPGKIPPTQPLAPGDSISSMFIAGAVAASLLLRERTGRGQKVTLSLYQNAVWSLGWEVQAVLSAGIEAGWRYQHKALNPLSNRYQTKDGRWIELACVQSDPRWHPFCDAIGRTDLKQDPRFESEQKRRENNEVLISIINEAFSQKTCTEWEEILEQHGLLYERVWNLKEITNDPQAIENNFFAEVMHPSGKTMRLLNSPVRFNDAPASIRSLAPELGQHTEQVLLELGYEWEDIVRLKDEGVIG